MMGAIPVNQCITNLVQCLLSRGNIDDIAHQKESQILYFVVVYFLSFVQIPVHFLPQN